MGIILSLEFKKPLRPFEKEKIKKMRRQHRLPASARTALSMIPQKADRCPFCASEIEPVD